MLVTNDPIEALARAACRADGKDPDELIWIRDGREATPPMTIPAEFLQVRSTLYLPEARRFHAMLEAAFGVSK